MLTNFSIFNTIYNDAPQPWQLGFQDSASPSFTGIVRSEERRVGKECVP